MNAEEYASKSETEHGQQVAVFMWATEVRASYPLLELLFAIPNGGMRDKITASRLKAEGVKSGVPDLFLPVARYPYHGLFIEMKKVTDGKLSKVQKDKWHPDLTKQGYYVATCHGFQQARDCLVWYMELP